MNILLKDIIEKLKNYQHQQMANKVIEWLDEYKIEFLKYSIYNRSRLIRDLPIHEHFVNEHNAKNFGFKETIEYLNSISDENVFYCSCNTNSFSIAMYLTCDSLKVIGLIGIYRDRNIEEDRKRIMKLVNGES